MLFIFSCSFVILEFIRLWAHSRNAHQINRPSFIHRPLSNVRPKCVNTRTTRSHCWISSSFFVWFLLFVRWFSQNFNVFFSSSSLFVIVFSSFFFCVVYSLLLLSCLFCHTFSLLKWYRPLSVARSLFHWCFCEWSTFLFRPILATASNNNNASIRCLGRSEWTLRKRILL